MGWFDGFPFKSKEQIARERKEFEKRVFPLGPAHREAILRLLQQLTPKSKKIHDNERLYAFISAKDKFTLEDDPQTGAKRAFSDLSKQNWLNDEERRVIVSLVLLDAKAESIDQLPTAEMVLANLPSIDD